MSTCTENFQISSITASLLSMIVINKPERVSTDESITAYLSHFVYGSVARHLPRPKPPKLITLKFNHTLSLCLADLNMKKEVPDKFQFRNDSVRNIRIQKVIYQGSPEGIVGMSQGWSAQETSRRQHIHVSLLDPDFPLVQDLPLHKLGDFQFPGLSIRGTGF